MDYLRGKVLTVSTPAVRIEENVLNPRNLPRFVQGLTINMD